MSELSQTQMVSTDARGPTPTPRLAHVRGLARTLMVSSALVCTSLTLSGCFTQTLIRGQAVSDETLRDVQVGSSKEQVELVLGTPTTTATAGGESFYYISQREETTAFLAPRVTEQRVVAIYFDDESRVRDIANYGLQDGKIFDFIKRKTRTGGADFGLLTQIFTDIEEGSPQQLF